jgi:hypothetical protein
MEFAGQVVRDQEVAAYNVALPIACVELYIFL